MVVKGHAGQAVVREVIVDDHVGVDLVTGPGREKADSRAGSRDLIPITSRDVMGDGVIKDAERLTAAARGGRVGSKRDSAVEGVIPK